MDFVTSAANLRMHIFSMNMKSRFDVKCKFVVLIMYRSVVNLFLYMIQISLWKFNHSVVKHVHIRISGLC